MSEYAPLLFFTGHPLLDVGIAGICAFLGRETPEQITLDDLDRISEFLIENYYQGKLGTFLSCVFMNASFIQPKETPEKTEEFKNNYLRAHRRAIPDPSVQGRKCVFSGLPATCALTRTQLPLFSGQEVINYRPEGQTSVPVAGSFVVALFFLPMAGRRAEGRLLIVHSSDMNVLMGFASKFLEDNQRLIALELPNEKALIHEGYAREIPMWDAKKKINKYADVKGPRSLVISDFADIASKAAPSDIHPKPSSLTIYWLSNSGQGPSIEIFDVPSNAINFIRKALGPNTAGAWKLISSRFRSLEEPAQKGKKKSAKKAIEGRPGWSRNPAFEDFCKIFDVGFTDHNLAQKWLQRFVLGRLEFHKGERKYESTKVRLWNFTALFLEEVIEMKKGRVEKIRVFADKIANWIYKKNDRKLHNSLFFDRSWEFQQTLLRVQRESAREELLFGLDEYSDVWLFGENSKSEMSLVRDLICIRVVEQLYGFGYYNEHPEEIIDKTPEVEKELGSLKEPIVDLDEDDEKNSES